MDKIISGMRYTDDMATFFGSNAPFSNFYANTFEWEGYVVKSSEYAFMIEKALMFEPSKAPLIAKARTPKEAKALGRSIQNFCPQKWDNERYGIMVEILKAKFVNPRLKQILLDTGERELVEGSPYDAIWGVKLDWQSDEILDRNKWRGQNLLGQTLMEVRDFYKP